jgi:polysaccharide biosynthesis protein PslF
LLVDFGDAAVAVDFAPSVPKTATRASRSLSAGFVGTYPPTRCGIATFNASLRKAMALLRSGVVACVDEPGATRFGPEVVAELVRGSVASLEAAAAALETFDVAIVQHEFGIYGGEDGADAVDLVTSLNVPAVVVMHTVLASPTLYQRALVEDLASAAEVVIVHSRTARSRLLETYGVSVPRVHVIAHGASLNVSARATGAGSARRPVIVTRGLLWPDKGIEFGIAAVSRLRDLDPLPRYVVHGQTHPHVLKSQGEAYRESLLEQVRALGVGDLVEFDADYGDTESVLAWIRAADVVLLPYCSHDQVVSGVLVEAIASGKPVVATRFPHAVELLSEGSGILVPHDDPAAIAAGLRTLLSNPELAARAAAVARTQAPALAWENVGRAYRELAACVVRMREESGR